MSVVLAGAVVSKGGIVAVVEGVALVFRGTNTGASVVGVLIDGAIGVVVPFWGWVDAGGAAVVGARSAGADDCDMLSGAVGNGATICANAEVDASARTAAIAVPAV